MSCTSKQHSLFCREPRHDYAMVYALIVSATRDYTTDFIEVAPCLVIISKTDMSNPSFYAEIKTTQGRLLATIPVICSIQFGEMFGLHNTKCNDGVWALWWFHHNCILLVQMRLFEILIKTAISIYYLSVQEKPDLRSSVIWLLKQVLFSLKSHQKCLVRFTTPKAAA